MYPHPLTESQKSHYGSLCMCHHESSQVVMIMSKKKHNFSSMRNISRFLTINKSNLAK